MTASENENVSTTTRRDDDPRDVDRRAHRHAQRRRVAKRSGVLTFVLIALAAIVAYLLFNTLRGRDVLLSQIVARLPAGTELRWSRAEGPASGPMTLYDVRYVQRGCPDEKGEPVAWPNCATPSVIAFAAKRVTLDPTLRPLLGRTLRLEALDVADAALILPESDEPFELPRWPESLPRIAPPLALQAAAIRIDRLKILRRDDKRIVPVVRIDTLRGGIDAEDGRLRLQDIAADTDRGRFALRGDYVPRERYRTDLVATAVLPAPAGRTPARLGMIAKGDVSALDIGIGGRVPAPVRIALALRGERDPQWMLNARGERLRVSALTGEDVDDAAYAFDLRVRGDEGAARLEGRIAQTLPAQRDDAAGQTREIAILPSSLSLREQVLTVAPLSLALFDGRAELRGRLDVRTPTDPHFDGTLAARGLRWRGEDKAAAEIVGDGDIVLAGRLRDWTAKGGATLQRAGERAKLELQARGDAEHADIAMLRATMPSGRLDGSGRLEWTPMLRWRADATLAGFDPGYLWPDWPGAVNGRLRSEGNARDDGAIDVLADASELGGRLRGRALQGRGKVQLRLPAAPQTRIDGEGEIALRIGESRIDARGKIANELAIDATFAPLRLNDLLPQAQGALRGTLRLTGARTQPNIDVDLVGDDVRLRRLSCRRATCARTFAMAGRWRRRARDRRAERGRGHRIATCAHRCARRAAGFANRCRWPERCARCVRARWRSRAARGSLARHAVVAAPRADDGSGMAAAGARTFRTNRIERLAARIQLFPQRSR